YAENAQNLAAPEAPVPNQPKIGDESIMTGGQAGSGDFIFRGFVVVARVDNVIFKINTLDTKPVSKLSPLTLTMVAQKHVARIKAVK
ncbi:MAG TPA: hypothetical protein VG713_03015, partial [Pirellulales bacterium]|nr:hypothetical protein [Pirellulales bacterium]